MSYVSEVLSTILSGNAGETTTTDDQGVETTVTNPSEHKHILGAMAVSALLGAGGGIYAANQGMVPEFLNFGA